MSVTSLPEVRKATNPVDFTKVSIPFVEFIRDESEPFMGG